MSPYGKSYLFKIDLIVWKYTGNTSIANDVDRFKIDLIVWKYMKESEPDEPQRKFKIDLIVWKLTCILVE